MVDTPYLVELQRDVVVQIAAAIERFIHQEAYGDREQDAEIHGAGRYEIQCRLAGERNAQRDECSKQRECHHAQIGDRVERSRVFHRSVPVYHGGFGSLGISTCEGGRAWFRGTLIESTTSGGPFNVLMGPALTISMRR